MLNNAYTTIQYGLPRDCKIIRKSHLLLTKIVYLACGYAFKCKTRDTGRVV